MVLSNLEKEFWKWAFTKALMFVGMTIMVVLLTIRVEKEGFDIINTFWNVDAIGVFIFAVLYIISETKIAFLISNEF